MVFHPTSRQTEILALARRIGRVQVDVLAQHFDVTPQTIRKDLNELREHGLIARVHGGATLASGVENVAYEARRHLAAREKRAIGAAAAQIVPDKASLFVNIGTTTEEVARSLMAHQGLLVITNNIHVVSILMPSPHVEVIVAGGLVRRSDGGIVGEATIDLVAQFRVDYAVIGASAIDEDGALLDFDYREVRVSQKIIENARKVILVADSMKFARSAPVRIGHVSQIDVFVTDRPPPEAFAALARQFDVEIVVAAAEENGVDFRDDKKNEDSDFA